VPGDRKHFGVARCDPQRCRRNIHGVNSGKRQFLGEGDGDAPRAGADVSDEEASTVISVGAAGTEIGKGQAVESDFDEVFGFWTRDEDVGGDFEGEAPEFLPTREMLQGHAGGPAVEETLIVGRFFAGELGFGVSIEKGTFTVGGVKKKQFGG